MSATARPPIVLTSTADYRDAAPVSWPRVLRSSPGTRLVTSCHNRHTFRECHLEGMVVARVPAHICTASRHGVPVPEALVVVETLSLATPRWDAS